MACQTSPGVTRWVTLDAAVILGPTLIENYLEMEFGAIKEVNLLPDTDLSSSAVALDARLILGATSKFLALLQEVLHLSQSSYHFSSE